MRAYQFEIKDQDAILLEVKIRAFQAVNRTYKVNFVPCILIANLYLKFRDTPVLCLSCLAKDLTTVIEVTAIAYKLKIRTCKMKLMKLR